MNDVGFQGTGSRFNSRFESGSPILAKQLNDLASGIQASLPMPYLGDGTSVSYLPGGSIITSLPSALPSSPIEGFQVSIFSQVDGEVTTYHAQIAKGAVISNLFYGSPDESAGSKLNGTFSDTQLFVTNKVAVYPTLSLTAGSDPNSIYCNSGGDIKLPSASIGTEAPPVYFYLIRNAFPPTSGSTPSGWVQGWPYLACIQSGSDAYTKTTPFIVGSGYQDHMEYITYLSASDNTIYVYDPSSETPITVTFSSINPQNSDQHLVNYNCQRLLLATLTWDSVNGGWTVTQNLSGHITWLLNMTLKEIVIQTTSYTTAALYGSNQNSWFAPYSGYDFGYLSATELLTP